MKLESVRVLRGANIWGNAVCLEALLVLETVLPVADRRALRAAAQHSPVVAASVALELFDVAAPAWPTLLAQLAFALQPRVSEGIAASSVRVVPDARDPRRVFRLVVPYLEEEVGKRALDLGFRWIRSLARGTGTLDVAAEYRDLCKLDQSVRLGPSTLGIVRAAEVRGIPVRRLTDGSLVQFGFGSRQRRIWAAETDATGLIAESIAQDKQLTKQLLEAAQLPVPRGMPVTSREEAWRTALALGLPVVVKPRNGNQGKGVSVRLTTEQAVHDAYDEAAGHDGSVLIEQHIEGADYRLLVVGDRLVAAARREVPMVKGDGQSTIRQLVELENQNPLRGEDHATALSKLVLDVIADEVLAEQGLTVESVPTANQCVVLRRNANLSTGGTAMDVTETVHPEIARAAVDAARVVGLDIAGIDLVASSVTDPVSETRGAMVEVNAAPGLRMHLEPSSGQARPVGQAIVEQLFGREQTGRIPLVAVTGTNGKTTTTRAIAHLFRQSGLRVGMTCTDGIYVDQLRIDTGDCSGPKSARMVLAHPDVDAAVLETARGGILREGLGFDCCDVAVVTNLGTGDHLGLGGIETVTELAHVKGTIVRCVSPGGVAVLNAEDPEVVALAAHCPGQVIYFAKTDNHPVIEQHRAAGGRCVTVREGMITWSQRGSEQAVAHVEALPLTCGGVFDFQIENLLAVAATGWFYGMDATQVALALSTFASDLGTVPGRMNVIRYAGSTLILDYGHNSSALLALTNSLARLPHRRRKVVYTAAGDRRDEDIRDQARILADFFDEIYIYEDQCTRGRKDGEILALMREGFRNGRLSPSVIHGAGELASIESAIRGLETGDVLLCQVDQVDAGLAFVEDLLARLAREPHLNVDETRRVFGGWVPARVSGFL